MGELCRHHMPATWFVVTGSVGALLDGRSVLSWADWFRASQQGMEIAAHTVTHPKLALTVRGEIMKTMRDSLRRRGLGLVDARVFSKAKRVFAQARDTVARKGRGVRWGELLEEAIQSKRAIEEKIPFHRVTSFAYPGGRYNRPLQQRLKEAGFLSARSTEAGHNPSDIRNLYALKTRVWHAAVNTDTANEWVVSAVKEGAWLIEVFHIITTDGTTGYPYEAPFSSFRDHVSYIASQDVWVDTQENITKYIRQRGSGRVNVSGYADKAATIFLHSSGASEAGETAVTLKTRVPSHWTKVAVMQDEARQEIAVGRGQNSTHVCYEAIPNGGPIALRPL